MKLKIAQVIGLNTDQKAAQVISSVRNGDQFLAVLDLSCDDAFTKGRQALSEISDFYFDFEGAPAEKLTATFEEAEKKLAPAEFALLVGSVSGKILYLIHKGQLEAYLKRLDKVSSLLSVGAPNQLISGFLQEGDRLLFSTPSLISFLADDLDKTLNLPIDTFEEEVTDRIGATTTENQGLAALAVEVEIEEMLQVPNLEGPVSNHQPTETIPSYEDSPQLKINIISQLKQILKATKKYFPKSGRGRLLVAVILIIIIALGVGFKVKSSKDAQKQASFNQFLQQAKDDFNKAKGLTTLNPADAKAKLDSATSKVNQAVSLKPQDRDAQNLKKQIEQDSTTILQQSKVSEFPVFLDMELVKKNFRAAQMSLSSEKLLLLDPAVKTLVVIDLTKKSNQVLAGSDQLGDATFASLNGGLAFVYSKDKGVIKIDIQNQKLMIVSKKDSQLGGIKDIYGFAGNVYLLDLGNPPAGGMIWKYLPTSDGYSDKREYLNKGTGGGSATKADLGNTVRMQIESSVYLLNKDGEMIRFTRGDKDNFSYGGLDKGVKDPKSFFVSSDTDNLYLLDSGNSRMLILSKTGSYKGQISGDKFAQASDLVVDEKGKKVYLLDGSKIYQVDLK